MTSWTTQAIFVDQFTEAPPGKVWRGLTEPRSAVPIPPLAHALRIGILGVPREQSMEFCTC